MNKECEGCNNTCDIAILKAENDGSCPCSICLVKTMCTITCGEWFIWVKTATGWEGGK